MAETFLTRSKRSGTIRTRDGKTVEMEKCTISVSRIKTGEYRCYKCPDRVGAGVQHAHRVFHDPDNMLLHAVDHLIAGETVPTKGLHRLAQHAIRFNT